MRRARELVPVALLALLALVVAACGGAGAPRPPASPSQTAAVSERTIAFVDAGATARSERSFAGPAIEAVRTGSGLRITAYQGEQRTGGFAIRIERVAKVGSELRVVARFTAPAPDAMVTMALTSPAHTVTVGETADTVVLYDTTGAERARASPR